MYRTLLAVLVCLAAIEAHAGCSMPLEATVYIGANGPFRFLVDTGSTTTTINRPVADAIGLQTGRAIAAIGTTGAMTVREAVVHDFRAGLMSMPVTNVLITDLPRFPSHGRLDGILGMNFFAGHALLIDARRRCLEVDPQPPRGSELLAHEIAGRVAIEVDGLNFILDSGASFVVLTSSRARAMAVEDGAMEMTSASGRNRVSVATLRALRIGSILLRDVPVAIAPGPDPREDALLPITPFTSVYIAADRRSVIVR